MRRSICYCEPNNVLAGEVNTWKFVYTTANELPKGARLKFDLASEGRSVDWEVPVTDLEESGNIIYALTDSAKKPISAVEIEQKDRPLPLYEFVLPAKVEAGESIAIIMGAPKGKKTSEKTGNMAQCIAQRRRNFFLSIDTSGKGHYGEPEVFTLDIRGNVLSKIRIVAPSFATRNKRFDVIVRFEDEFGNLTNNTHEDTLIELGYEHQRENLNWKLFVPETGFITLPNLYFNEPGIYTIHLRNTLTGDLFKAAPIKCFEEAAPHLYWGLLHGESEKIDSMENIESCLRHFRDEKAYNFYATSHFESNEETPQEIWKLALQNVTEFDESERFTTLLGFQWSGEDKKEGARHIIFSKDNKQILRKKEPKGSSLKKIYKSFSPKELISIPTFTMAEGHSFDFKDFNPEFERVAEIYNAWGSSEYTEKEGNSRPITKEGKNGFKSTSEGSLRAALAENCRFGFVAGGLDDRGIYSDLFESEQVQYSPGLTAIIGDDQSRNGLFEALYRRSCYATTGERMILNISLSGVPMGGEVSTGQKPGLSVNRHIAGFAAGTKNLKRVELIRNGEILKVFEPKDAYSLDFTYDDMEDLSEILIASKDGKRPPFLYYYLRVIQEDGHMAWSSPIWVDDEPLSPSERRARRTAKTPPKKPTVKELFGEFDADEEDEEDVTEVEE